MPKEVERTVVGTRLIAIAILYLTNWLACYLEHAGVVPKKDLDIAHPSFSYNFNMQLMHLRMVAGSSFHNLSQLNPPLITFSREKI